MTFHHGDTVRKPNSAQGALGVLGIVVLRDAVHSEATGQTQYSVLWDDAFTHTYETEDSITLVKRLPVV